MANLYLDIYPAGVQANQSADGLRKMGLSDVSDCSGFIPQGLRDKSRYKA